MIDLKLLRDNPDVVRASQRARGEDPGLVDALLDGRRGPSRGGLGRRQPARRAEGGEQEGGRRVHGGATGAAGAGQGARREGQGRRSRAGGRRKGFHRSAHGDPERHHRRCALPVARTTSRCSTTVGEPPAIDDPKDHLELGESLGLIDLERGAKVSGARFYFLTGHGALLQLGLLQLAVRLATDNGFTLDDPAGAGSAGDHGGHRVPRCAREEVYRLEADDLYLVGTSEVPLAGYHSDEILDLSGGPAALRRLVVVLPARGGQPRQGHPRNHPRAPVRQGRGLRLLQAGGGRGRTRAPAWLGAPDARQHRRAVPRDRRRRRGSRVHRRRASTTARRGCRPSRRTGS